jgi:hypothetical protein
MILEEAADGLGESVVLRIASPVAPQYGSMDPPEGSTAHGTAVWVSRSAPRCAPVLIPSRCAAMFRFVILLTTILARALRAVLRSRSDLVFENIA